MLGINIEWISKPAKICKIQMSRVFLCIVVGVVVLCAKCCSAAQFVCMLFQYRHRISNNLKIFVQHLNVATIPFQLYFNFNKAFCDYSAFPNFQIVYPFRINQVVRFSHKFFFHFIFAFFEIITWHFARCFQSFDTWFVLFESFAHDDCQIIFNVLRQQPQLAKWIVVWAFIMWENASIWESFMVFIDVQP